MKDIKKTFSLGGFAKFSFGILSDHTLVLVTAISCMFTNASLFALQFSDIKNRKKLFLYAGDLVDLRARHSSYKNFIGLSLGLSDAHHIKHDVTKPFDLRDNSVDIFQSEDVFEHIEYDLLPSVLEEVFRVLKPGGFCRISVPDYRCDLLIARSIKDMDGNILFDPGGGGSYKNGKVIRGGHVWFPTIESVTHLVQCSSFSRSGRIKFLQYYDEEGNSIIHPTDYSICKVKRTPDFDKRVQNPRRVMSLVVDLYKK